MTERARQLSVAEEMERCSEEVRAAESLIEAGMTRVAITRVYYAVFHAVRAALYAEGVEPRSHRGALHLFNTHFIRSGRLNPSTSRLIARLQKYREEADYGEAFLIDDAGVREELRDARGMIETLRATLNAAS